MPPIPLQQVGALIEGLGDVKPRNATSRAFGLRTPLLSHQRGTIELLRQTAGYQPHNAGVELRMGDEIQEATDSIFQDYLASLLNSRLGQGLSFAVLVVKFLGQLPSAEDIVGDEQLVSIPGMLQSPGCIEPGAKHKADGDSIDLPRLNPGLSH